MIFMINHWPGGSVSFGPSPEQQAQKSGTDGETAMSTAEVRTSALSGWMERAGEFGFCPREALAAAGIDLADASAQRETIPLTGFTRMAEFVGDHASSPAASWLIGEGYDLAGLGEVGGAVLSAKTLGGALRRLADHFELLQQASRLSFEAGPDCATISYRILDPEIWPRHQDALFSLGIITKIIKLAVPDAMDSLELGFECARRDTGLALAQAQLAFECEANSVRLPARMLDAAMPPSAAQCDLRALSSRLAESRRRRSTRERLSGIILARLAEGEVNQDELACEIGMSSRTMRRRLADEDTSFQTLLEDCRMRQAVLEFAVRPQASLAEIALRLGYAEHSTFTRAFRRWAGTPPQRYRSEMAATRH